MTDPRRIRVLFLCTGNSCRSQMGEAILRHLGGDRFEVFSAGSHPAGFVHPLAIDALAKLGVPITDGGSKSWNEFAETSMDVVITVCDAAAGEPCPVWVGAPLTAHWSLPDPVFQLGTDEERLAFTLRVAERLRAKIQGLVDLDWSSKPEQLRRRLEFLGEI